jgi:hypothetical protein
MSRTTVLLLSSKTSRAPSVLTQSKFFGGKRSDDARGVTVWWRAIPHGNYPAGGDTRGRSVARLITLTSLVCSRTGPTWYEIRSDQGGCRVADRVCKNNMESQFS